MTIAYVATDAFKQPKLRHLR